MALKHDSGLRVITPQQAMENEMEKNMECEMETGILQEPIRIRSSKTWGVAFGRASQNHRIRVIYVGAPCFWNYHLAGEQQPAGKQHLKPSPRYNDKEATDVTCLYELVFLPSSRLSDPANGILWTRICSICMICI